MTFRERLMLACAGLLVAACAIVFVRYGTYQHLIRHAGWDNAFTHAVFADDEGLWHYQQPRTIPADEVPVDWAARYPFPKDQAAAPAAQERSFFPALQQAERRIQQQEQQFADWANGRFPHRFSFVYAKNAYDDALGWNIALLHDINSAVQLPDGHLTSFLGRMNLARHVEATADFAAFCQENGIHFLLVLAPGKTARSDLYAGTLDRSNENGDAFLAGLREKNIDCLDLRTAIEAEGLEPHPLFFRTDHHWTPDAARWAAQHVLSHLNDACGYTADLSLLDASRFDEERHAHFYLGSHGAQVTCARTAPDDFSLYFPTFPTSFRLDIPSMAIDASGDFSILYDRKKMQMTSAYETYAYGNRALLDIQNMNKKDGRKLLLIHDSFADAMTPFFALGMEELQSIDPRYFSGSLRTYLQQERPDTVILFYDIIEFNLDSQHATPRSPFDLR